MQAKIKLFTTMAQETLNGLLTYLLGALSYDNRRWLAEHLVEPQVEEKVVPYTWEKINQRLDESEREIAAGICYTNEEVMDDLRKIAL